MKYLSIDFETRSTLDLPQVGAYRYAQHPTTDLWCASYGWSDEEAVHSWLPGQPPPEDLVEWVESGGAMRAWNVAFERVIWKYILTPRYGFPEPTTDLWHDTMIEAVAMGLPRALFAAAKALRLGEQKDSDGYKLMMQMAKPRSKKGGKVVWWNVPEKIARLVEYCEQDVVVERAIGRRTRRMDETERKYWLMDQRMNERGVALDLDFIRGGLKLAKRGMDDVNALIKEITGGAVTAVTKPAEIARWLQYRGHEVTSVRKSVVRDLLEGDELQPVERQVLELRAEGARSSVAKLRTALAYACDDERARGLQLFHGAGTGRWTGMGIQPHNFPRPEKGVKPLEYTDLILNADYERLNELHPVLIALSCALRGMFVASPGHRLLVGDYKAIEARVLNWLAEQEDVLRIFAQGGDPYLRMASYIYGESITDKDDPRRQDGKIVELGSGYQMGWKTYRKQAKEQWGMDLTEEDAKHHIKTYRETHAQVRRFWNRINAAALRAVARPGEVQNVGRRGCIRYVVKAGFLWCILPSGRPLGYAFPQIVQKETPWGEFKNTVRIESVDRYTRRWGPQYLYGGLLTENVVQAISRDIMAAAMLRLEERGYKVPVLTVHDEIVCDTPDTVGSVEQFRSLMEVRPSWAADLPIDVEANEGDRYTKW